MLFGKTWQQRDEEEQTILRNLKDNPPRWFAWYPVQLDTGEYVWWEELECMFSFMEHYQTGRLTLWSNKYKYRRVTNE